MIINKILIVGLMILCCSYQTISNKTDYKDTLINEPNIQNNDSIIVYIDETDTIKYSKEQLDTILNCNKSLNDKVPSSPLEAFTKSYCNSENKKYIFGSESGQDEFYAIYSYFLKKKNGVEKYKLQRQRLTDIFRTINDIYSQLSYGGTYYGHQYIRIVGFVEYSIYSQIDNDYYIKKYDYNYQKKIYLETFQQMIRDEISVDDETNDKQKKQREIQFLKKVQKLNSLITNYSDLKSAQKFQYANY